ncbi:MAG TPA: NAD(P)/FAD-dependent oxidoreductase [Oculatellaceae cyanobacterium]
MKDTYYNFKSLTKGLALQATESEKSNGRTAIIIGAGPAGLTAAYELLKKTDIKPIVVEQSDYLGGLSRTVNYKGNRIDIGGHRFFSKSDRVMDWWLEILPMQQTAEGSQLVTYRRATTAVKGNESGPDPTKTDRVMLVRNRKSRIYFMRKFFAYPVSLSLDVIKNLGLFRTAKVGISYVWSSFFPIKPEKSLEDFLTNRFGKELYLTFFKSYTEKVWGVPCHEISAAWGAQRIKGLSLWKALYHFFRKALPSSNDVSQKDTETTLIERFLYPKLGPGQMWETVAEIVREKGGEIIMDSTASSVSLDGKRVTTVEIENVKTHERRALKADFVFSTMPVKELISAMKTTIPANVKEVSEGLVYRDFITVGLLVKKMVVKDKHTEMGAPELGRTAVADNWIYIQEPDVKLGRLQIFNNWSPYMVADPSLTWLGLEYFCDDTDDMWRWDDKKMVEFAGEELERIGIIRREDILDSVVIHMPKTYPGYFGTYGRFDELINWIDQFENLFLVGRNGMHKYNNQDHSMLTAMVAVENIVNGVKTKENLWSINTEEEYHEEKKTT